MAIGFDEKMISRPNTIIVIDRGIVIEQGTHNELFNKKGEF